MTPLKLRMEWQQMMWWMIQARASPELHLAQDPLAQDPLAQDPLAQDHPLIHHQALSHLTHALAPPAEHAAEDHHAVWLASKYWILIIYTCTVTVLLLLICLKHAGCCSSISNYHQLLFTWALSIYPSIIAGNSTDNCTEKKKYIFHIHNINRNVYRQKKVINFVLIFMSTDWLFLFPPSTHLIFIFNFFSVAIVAVVVRIIPDEDLHFLYIHFSIRSNVKFQVI